MPSSLVRGRHLVCGIDDDGAACVIDDGAVFQRDGVIVEVGPYAELARRHQPDETLGSERHVIIPGLVDSHHHIGLTPVQMGSPDLPLELWFASRLRKRNIDPYLDTLYSAIEMIESGITTVQHLHSRANGPIARVHGDATRILSAYHDIGMRVSYAYTVRDQNRMVYAPDNEFLARLPAELAGDLRALLHAQNIPLEDNFALFEQLRREHAASERVRIQLAPANLHWCSDRALELLRDVSEKHDAPLHMHLLETQYQREYSRRRSAGGAVDHLHRMGLLGPRLTLGHGVWLTDADIDLLAQTGTRLCHNASSNLRLRSGIAPINALARRGVRVSLGLDEAGINDDRDMLQEMRLVLRLHRTPGMDDGVPTAAQVLRMATENGAATTGFGATLGRLEPGQGADLVLIDWRSIAYPYLDAGVPIVDAVLLRAKTSAVDTVIVAGEPVLRDGRFTRLDKAAVLEELAASLRAPLLPEEERRVAMSDRLLPHVLQFYRDEGYLDAGGAGCGPGTGCTH
jgi:cytosine/adenosine deaminase-related metal-dependent hydrolase